MRKQHLHLSTYACDTCAGPVIAGSTAVRENEISKETEIRQVGAICLSCGHRQDKAAEPARPRHLPPIAGGTLDYLKIWSSLTRGRSLLACEYWMSPSTFHNTGVRFDNGYEAEELAHILEFGMQPQDSFVLPRTSAGRDCSRFPHLR